MAETAEFRKMTGSRQIERDKWLIHQEQDKAAVNVIPWISSANPIGWHNLPHPATKCRGDCESGG